MSRVEIGEEPERSSWPRRDLGRSSVSQAHFRARARLGRQYSSRVITPLLRRYAPPRIHQLIEETGGVLHRDAQAFLRGVFGERLAATTPDIEFDLLTAELQQRQDTSTLASAHPQSWAVAHEVGLCLYTLARFTNPGAVLETGVANGHSSFLLLNALARNGHGTLHSIDVSARVAPYLNARERQRWNLVILDGKRRRQSFLRAMKDLPAIDIFVHDSDHSWGWQSLEYRAALSVLRSGGFLASDDVDSSHAFLTFCRDHALVPHLLFDGQRVFGLVTKE